MPAFRAPQIDLQSLLSQQNPHIDLSLDVYKESTRNFLKAVSNYKSRAIAAISERREHQAAERKKYVEKCQAIEIKINQCKLRELELVAELELEKEERKDAELAFAAFQRQLASLHDKCSGIHAEIEHYHAGVASLQRGTSRYLLLVLFSQFMAEKDNDRATLNTFAAQAAAELAACDNNLRCAFEGIEKDRILIRFFCLNPVDPEQECNLVLDASSTLYKVITSSPKYIFHGFLTIATLITLRDADSQKRRSGFGPTEADMGQPDQHEPIMRQNSAAVSSGSDVGAVTGVGDSVEGDVDRYSRIGMV
ncbi:hypothetical protein APHAL10511_003841 [Amanita phalloides]|nr:hypothetical protein APHAL10511_003841 [Amanita phalloides]